MKQVCNPLYFQGNYKKLFESTGAIMDKKFRVESSGVSVVGSVSEYQQKVGRTKGERPPVHQSAREVLAGAPPVKTMTDAVQGK